MSLPVWTPKSATLADPYYVCVACQAMDRVDAATGLCRDCWRVVVLVKARPPERGHVASGPGATTFTPGAVDLGLTASAAPALAVTETASHGGDGASGKRITAPARPPRRGERERVR